MAVTASSACRQAPALFRSSRSLSCPDIARPGRKIILATQVRHINMMLLNPRAPKIRHLNASHSLLVEMEKHVRKVQELEHKVLEMERQLQLRELAKAQMAVTQAVQEVKKTREREVVSEEARRAFDKRLAEARIKTKEMTAKRAQEEANILRSWHMKKLGNVINKLSQVPEEKMILLPCSMEVTEKDLASHMLMLKGLEGLVDTMHPVDEVGRLQVLVQEREELRKLIEDIQAKEEQTRATLEECKNTLHNVGAARFKVKANLKMASTVLDTMQNLGQKRKSQDIFVFGPNPIFSSVKEVQLNCSISNQFVIEMLKELDITHIIAQKNLLSAEECEKKYRENKAQLEGSLDLVQASIEQQIDLVNMNTESDKEIKMKPHVNVLTNAIVESTPKEVGKGL